MFIDLVWITASIFMFISKVITHSGMESVLWGIAIFYGIINYVENSFRVSGKYDEVPPSTKERRD